MTIASQEGDFVRTSHGPDSYGFPSLTSCGSHACDLSIRYFMPRSHEAVGQSTGSIRAKACVTMRENTRHALRVHRMFQRILNCAVYPVAEG